MKKTLIALTAGNVLHGKLAVSNSVIRAGVEPATHSLEGCCSIQLSYRTVTILFAGYTPASPCTNMRNGAAKVEQLFGLQKIIAKKF